MDQPKAQFETGSSKRIYREPNLRVYGDITSITQTGGNSTGKMDAGPVGNNKTK